jgi:DNA-binding sugar fermentation-stimulating protein
MLCNTDGRDPRLVTGNSVRVGGCVGDGRLLSLSPVADHRRFRVKHALQSIEDALILLDTERPNGVQVTALEQIRDDLAVVLRVAEAECR